MKQSFKGAIGAQSYEIRPMQTSEQARILIRLTKMLAPVLGTAVGNGSLQEAMSNPNMNWEGAAKALAGALDEEQMVLTLNQLFDKRYVSLGTGMPIDFESHFSGEMGHMMAVVGKVLEVNYSDFFVALRGIMGVSKTSE